MRSPITPALLAALTAYRQALARMQAIGRGRSQGGKDAVAARTPGKRHPGATRNEGGTVGSDTAVHRRNAPRKPGTKLECR